MTSSPTSILSTIMGLLSDGAYHSGRTLGEALGMSRAAIWKHIQQLNQLGVAITSVPSKGYALVTPCILLDKQTILRDLKAHYHIDHDAITIYDQVTSTQEVARSAPNTPSLGFHLAEHQSQGRGRFGRSWYSPWGSNIYLSFAWSVDRDISELSGLSLILSLALIKALQAAGVTELGVKWPNDLIWHDKKLGGILVEMDAVSYSHTRMVIGIGINVNTPEHAHNFIPRAFTSLQHILGRPQDRNSIAAHMIYYLTQDLTKFLAQGLSAFLPEWQQYDVLYGKPITITSGKQKHTGIMHGINAQGQLLLKQADGQISKHSAGETSLAGMYTTHP